MTVLLRWIAWVLLGVVAPLAVRAQQPEPPPESLIAAMQARREAFFDSRGLDLRAVSRDINDTLDESDRLGAAGQYRQALERLRALERYAPLEEFPSVRVQLGAAALHASLGQPEREAFHLVRARAVGWLITGRVGKGTLDDPVRMVLTSEVADWVFAYGARASDVRSYPYRGRELMVVTYAGRGTAGPSRQVFVELDPRTQAQQARSSDLFEPLALQGMTPAMLAAMEEARGGRRIFLEDVTFNYLSLRRALNAAIVEANALAEQGQPREALARLRQLETIRPLDQIPTPRLLSMYSYLLGQTEDETGQRRIRLFNFGVQQVIAHSGDGRGPGTAVHVILIDEEYQWIAGKKLTRVSQSLRHVGGRSYDVLHVKDAAGNESDVWFDITQLFAREGDSLRPASK